jgi:hypothetical protein
VLPSFNFPQLDFMKPSSGFHPMTWERVTGGLGETASKFEFIFGIAQELSKESLGRKEVADCNG